MELRDVNDSPPHFSQNVYALEIPEDHPLDRTVLTIPVNDPDTTGSVQLSIRSGNNRTFTISDSGDTFSFFIISFPSNEKSS